MRPLFNRWTVLVAGVLLAWAAMLAIRHVPGLKTPEIAENRVLATFPGKPAPTAAGLREYREGMDAYVNDNFPPRAHFIAGINLLRYRLGYSGTARVAVGRDGWLFYDDGSHLSQLRGPPPMGDADLRAWVDTLAARTDYLAQRGIPYLVVSAPLQERIYPEKAPAWAQRTGGPADTDVLEAAARQAGLDSVLSLYPVMVKQKLIYPDAYTAYDTHWTGNGAHGAYVALLDALRARGLDVTARPLSTFTPLEKPPIQQPQILAVMLGLASFVTQDFPQYTDPAIEAGLRVEYLTERRDWAGSRVIDTGVEGAPVLMITGDSFGSELFPFLYPHFSRIIISHYDDGFFRTDLVERFQPDAVILEMLESGLRHGMSPAMVPDPALAATLAARRAGRAGDAPAAVAAMPARAAKFRPGPRVAGDASDGSPGYRCNLEQLQPDAGAGGLQVSGWMANVDEGEVGDSLHLVLQSAGQSYRAPIAITVERPDVAAYFSRPGISRSGFNARLAMPSEPGDYTAYLVQPDGDRTVVCQTHVSITLPRVTR